MSQLAMAFLLFLLLSSASSLSHRQETITASSGIVATDDGRCSRIGRDILREGGHAVDASVAAAFCLGVVRPTSSGIGGGSFMLVRSANGKARGFDMREVSPRQTSVYMYTDNPDEKKRGALSVAVPGELAGLYAAWKKYGKLSWKRLVEPAEQLAHNGYKISKSLYNEMVRTESAIKADKGLRNIFTSSWGSLLQEGNNCCNINLANTLHEISNSGLQALYNGSIGMNLVRDVQNAGGILTMKDLQHYKVKLRNPISADILGHTILGMPPSTSGGATMILILNILAQYGSPSNISRSVDTHRIVEAFKYGYAVRTNLGDPDFGSVRVRRALSAMLSPDVAAVMNHKINDSMNFDAWRYGLKWPQVNDHGTTHICVVDRERNAVSMTTSVCSLFGSKIISPSTGIVLNNGMNGFTALWDRSPNVPPSPGGVNLPHPSQRPLSSMAPTIVLKNKKLKAVLGSGGGIYIPAAVPEIFLNHFVKGMDPLSSVMAPRFYHKLYPNVLYYENWTSVFGDHYEVPKKIMAALQKKGHVLQLVGSRTFGQFVVQQLEGSNSGKLLAASDPRRGGIPVGY